MRKVLGSLSAWSVLVGVLQRGSALVVTILIGQHHDLESLGQWALAQTLSLALLGAVGAGLSQLLTAGQVRTGQGKGAPFYAALTLSMGVSACVIVLVQSVLWFGVADRWGLPALPADALLAIWLYTVGGIAYWLASGHLLAAGAMASLRRLGVVGAITMGASIALAGTLGPWGMAAFVGCLMLLGSCYAVGGHGANPGAAWLSQARELFVRAWPLMLGNALIGPAIFVSMGLVGAHGGLADAALYNIANQWRNLFLMPLALVLPIHLQRRAQGMHASRGLYAVLSVMVVGLVVCYSAPEALFRLFSGSVAPPETHAVLRAALWSVPLAGLCALLSQELILFGMLRAMLFLNLAWCATLLGVYTMLQWNASAGHAMTQAHVAAYAVLGLGAAGIRCWCRRADR
ncbi:MAG: hypothetical protein QM777_00070 [Pseudorhodoferax sp.]